MSWIAQLNTAALSLEQAGGKGLNLARLTQAGFLVPPGFILTTSAYRAFTQENGLETRIQGLIRETDLEQPDALEEASHIIRKWFDAGQLPGNLADELRAAYHDLSGGSDSEPVAVRSSATAEDLPEVSFAGQQDTYLNVIGEAALLRAVVRCWSSLWTARAIGYRAHNHIPQQGIALAVVVQCMVASEASGVLFTANPLSGLRTEAVIDATLGLGEALVSGQVEPDHYVVDTHRGAITQKKLGAKLLSIRPEAQGGVSMRSEDASQQQALPDEQILALGKLGIRVAQMDNLAQDIEWAWAGNRLYLLQARPVTSLFPTPDGMPLRPLKVMVSFGAVQGILEPITPFGRDAVRQILTGMAQLFGYRIHYSEFGVVKVAGERLWLNATQAFKHPIGRKVASFFLPFVEPSALAGVNTILDDPDLKPNHVAGLPVLRVARFILPLIWTVLRTLADPQRQRRRGMENAPRRVAELEEKMLVRGETPRERLGQRLAVMRSLADVVGRDMPEYYLPPIVAGMASLNLANKISARSIGSTESSPQGGLGRIMMQFTRGLPHNVTTEMDLHLWETARSIRSDPESWQVFHQAPAEELARLFHLRKLPPASLKAVDKFMLSYGMRGVGEIDLGRKRWREDATPLMEALGSYLQIEDESKAPDKVFRQGKAAAEKALVEAENAIRKTHGGWLRARIFRWAIGRARRLLGLRESPKFFIVRIMGVVRQAMIDSGRELAAAGILYDPLDVFLLRLDELEALARGDDRDWKAAVHENRARQERERRRRQVPVLLLSDGRAFYTTSPAPAQSGQDALAGSPVSPGVVEGRVRVVFSPHNAGLLPGEILVCPGTDPAWTPLFLAAGGLIMEVGGMMTHGAVVAREYGIPAVVGVAQATQRLATGQLVRLDGSSGLVTVLDDNGDEL